MMLLTKIAEWSLIALGCVLFVAQLAAHEIGFRIGHRWAARYDVPSESAGLLVGGVLGLLALVLALTLTVSSDRFYERRVGSLAEANAISTAWLRAKAIDQPQAEEIARLLEQYTKLRMAYLQTDHDPAALVQLNKQTSSLQSLIWGDLSALVSKQPILSNISLMTSLNEVFDMSTAERFAVEREISPRVFWLLIGLAVLGMGMLGYQLSLKGSRMPVLAALLALTWTVVIVDILDLASPRLGDFRTSVAPYEWTLQGFQSGITVAP